MVASSIDNVSARSVLCDHMSARRSRYRCGRTSKGVVVRIDDDDDDNAAIRRCQGGDISGLEPLIARYQVPALRLAFLLVGERGAAEYVVQDSFILAYHAIARFRSDSRFAPWFYRIVTNSARQRLRRASIRHETSIDWLFSG